MDAASEHCSGISDRSVLRRHSHHICSFCAAVAKTTAEKVAVTLCLPSSPGGRRTVATAAAVRDGAGGGPEEPATGRSSLTRRVTTTPAGRQTEMPLCEHSLLARATEAPSADCCRRHRRRRRRRPGVGCIGNSGSSAPARSPARLRQSVSVRVCLGAQAAAARRTCLHYSAEKRRLPLFESSLLPSPALAWLAGAAPIFRADGTGPPPHPSAHAARAHPEVRAGAAPPAPRSDGSGRVEGSGKIRCKSGGAPRRRTWQ